MSWCLLGKAYTKLIQSAKTIRQGSLHTLSSSWHSKLRLPFLPGKKCKMHLLDQTSFQDHSQNI